jgi:hypothetical protein
MASISNDSSGGRRILFFDRNGDRKAVRLDSTFNQKAAETIKAKVEELLSCKAAGCSWSTELALWVGGLGDTLADKLFAAGLTPLRQRATLGDFLDGFLKKREGGKPNSLKNYKQAAGKLWDHFGRDTSLRGLSHSMADEWAMLLPSSGPVEIG